MSHSDSHQDRTAVRVASGLAASVAVAVCLGGTTGTSAAPPQNQSPTFRSGVELIQIDVSVLDKNARRPIAGLSAQDFTVMVDGKRRPIVAFKAVDVPPPGPAPTAPWMREVPADVATNVHPSGRVIAILIDDNSFGEAMIGPGGIQRARKTAQAAVDSLGVDDRAAVLYTANSYTSQGFTTDRRLLRTAIEGSAIFGETEAFASSSTGAGPISGSDQNGFCYCGVCSVESLVSVAEALRTLPEQRKIMLFVSAGTLIVTPKQPVLGPESECNRRKRDAMHDAIRQAQLANVTIQAVDPKGLDLGRLSVSASRSSAYTPTTQGQLDDPATHRIEFLRTMAESTGGRAVVNNNDMDRQVPGLLAESSTYYLLGVEPLASAEDGRFHPIQVRVNRSGVEVRTRNGFYDPTKKEREAAVAAGSDPDLPLAIASPVPKADLALEVASAPFVTPDQEATLVVAIGVKQPVDVRARGSAHSEVVDVAASLFSPETGNNAGTESQQLQIDWNATEAADGAYEILSRVPARPGRYELRVGVKTADGRTASVYSYTEIPDFRREALSLSGLVLAVTPAVATGAHADMSGLLPVIPTVRRVFRRTDVVTAFLRVYQMKVPTFVPVSVAARITDATNAVVDERSATLGAPSGTSSADYRLALPTATLPAGEYLLTIDATAAGRTARRTARFRTE